MPNDTKVQGEPNGEVADATLAAGVDTTQVTTPGTQPSDAGKLAEIDVVKAKYESDLNAMKSSLQRNEAKLREEFASKQAALEQELEKVIEEKIEEKIEEEIVDDKKKSKKKSDSNKIKKKKTEVIDEKKELIDVKYPDIIADINDIDIFELNNVDYFMDKKNNIYQITEDQDIGIFLGVYDKTNNQIIYMK